MQMFVVIYSQQEAAFIKINKMCAWKLCNEDLLIAQDYFQNDMTLSHSKSMYKSNTSHYNLRKCLSPKNKFTEKISLRKAHEDQKVKENVKDKQKGVERGAQLYKQTKNIHNSNILLMRSEQKDYQKKKPTQQITIQNFNRNIYQEYFIMPPIYKPIPMSFNQSTVRINYINPQKTIKCNKTPMQYQLNQSPIQKQTKPLKRINTLPATLPSSVVQREETRPQQFQEDKLSKSMNYNENLKINSLKSTHHLNQIECVKAESLLDSEEMRDEVSFALSPIDQGLQFVKGFTINQLWKDFAGREDTSQKSVSTPSSIHNREILI